MDGLPDVNVASFESLFSVLALAVISTALAYVLYFKILGSAGAINLSLVSFLVPISAILLGVLVLNESLEPIHFVGMTLIGFGLITIDGRMWRLFKAKFT
jgi:drug/metabolite transporter (DMT)-like permease